MNRRCYGLMVLLIIATAGDSIELAPSARKTKEIRLDWPGTDKDGIRYYDY